MCLGDGGLYVVKDQSPLTARLVIGHSPKQRDYLEYKTQLLNEIFGGKPSKINEYKSFNKQVQKEYLNIQVSRTEKFFRELMNIIYSSGKKKYTREILDNLTDHGLAIWYMDDGSGVVCKNKNGNSCGIMTRISTYCSYEEVLIIHDWFKDRYDIEIVFDIDKRSNKYSIRMKKESSIRFVQIVEPYIVPSMEYKIQHVKLY